MITQITTHVADGLNRLISQYQDQPNLIALMTALLQSIQTIEDGLFGLIEGRMLFGGGAIGAQLDAIGALIGASRGSLSDQEYRLLILGQIGANSGNGTASELLYIAKTVFEASSLALNTPLSAGHSQIYAPAVVGIELGDVSLPDSSWPLAINMLKKSIPAGANLSWMVIYSGDDAFALDGITPGLGFDDLTNPGSGGQLAANIYSSPAA